jgi:hypothetical protein
MYSDETIITYICNINSVIKSGFYVIVDGEKYCFCLSDFTDFPSSMFAISLLPPLQLIDQLIYPPFSYTHTSIWSIHQSHPSIREIHPITLPHTNMHIHSPTDPHIRPSIQ